ncbi:hypothetical protein GCM10027180_04550 [Microbulbifer echini]
MVENYDVRFRCDAKKQRSPSKVEAPLSVEVLNVGPSKLMVVHGCEGISGIGCITLFLSETAE